jgi:transketolase
MPCWELFDEQPEHYRRQVIDRGTVRVAVEAAVRQGWIVMSAKTAGLSA